MTISLAEKTGSNLLTASYKQTNETQDRKIDEGSFSLFFADGTGLPQYGFFNSFFPGDSRQRTYTWEYLKSQTPIAISYNPGFFAQTPSATKLNWAIPGRACVISTVSGSATADKAAADSAAAKATADKAAADRAAAKATADKAAADSAAAKATADKAATDSAAAKAAADKIFVVGAEEATAAANDATDAALSAAEAAEAATAMAQEAVDAVAELSARVANLMSELKTQITSLSNLIIKIQKKVRN